jgi:hypothetical protein
MSLHDSGVTRPSSGGSAEMLFGLNLSLLMSYIYGAPSKARNLTYIYIYIYIYIYGRDFLLQIFFLNRAFR